MRNTRNRVADQHIYGLDVMRCCAALLVATFHFTRVTPGVELLAPFGWVGVEIFFVISGCVIACSAQGRDAASFARGRFLRLYPTAWLVAALSLCVCAVIPAYGWREAAVTINFTPSGLFNSMALLGPGLTNSYWTLPVELSFYTCVFVLLRLGRLHWLMSFAFVLTVYAMPYMLLLGMHHAGVVDMPFLYFDLGSSNMLLVRHGPFFALGLYLFTWHGGGLTRRDRVGAALAAALCLLEIGYRGFEQWDGRAISRLASVPTLTIQAELIFAGAVALMMISLRNNDRFPHRLRGLSRALGQATYPYYLAHELLGGAVMFTLTHYGAGSLQAVLGALIAVGVTALVIASLIEPAFRQVVASALVRVPAWRRTARHGSSDLAAG